MYLPKHIQLMTSSARRVMMYSEGVFVTLPPLAVSRVLAHVTVHSPQVHTELTLRSGYVDLLGLTG